MNLKRLWDTENKKPVWVRNGKKVYQVWTDGDKLYIYDAGQWMEYNPLTSEVPAEEYGPTWKELTDEEVGYYETNVPTNMYNRDEGEDVAYAFKNGTTTLQSGKVDEGETPEYTGDTPTKSATAQYTYTFSGWKPTVGPIYKKTDFKAQFDSTVNEYDITIVSDDADKGTVDVAFVEGQPYGTAISVEDNVLTIGETEVTATAETGYVFSSWGELPATVTGDLTITAEFVAEVSNYLEWLNKVGEDSPNECVSLLTEGDGTWDIDPEVFKILSEADLNNLTYEITDKAEGISNNDFTVTLGANEDPDTTAEYPYYCGVSYSGDLSGFDPDAYVATITIQDVSGYEVLDIGTLTLNKTGA